MDFEKLKFRALQLKERLPQNSRWGYNLDVCLENIEESASFLSQDQYDVAFIGNVGCGKTTAICHLCGLIDDEGPLLAHGSGRTTICEVEIRQSEDDYIEIISMSKQDLAEYLQIFINDIEKQANTGGGLDNSLPDEFTRCLRNMLGLKKAYSINAKRQRQVKDTALELFKEVNDRAKYAREIIARLNYEQREKNTLFQFDETSNISWAEWLSKEFREINLGNSKIAPIPQKIIIHSSRVDNFNFSSDIRLVDTKGIDQSIFREDLRMQNSSARTISVLCTVFGDAPSASLIEMLKEAIKSTSLERIERETLFLVLDRPCEAERIIDLDEPDTEAGRNVRYGQVDSDIQSECGLSLDIDFYNASEDNPYEIREVIKNKISNLRRVHLEQYEKLSEALDEIEEGYRLELSVKSTEQVKKTFEPWIRKADQVNFTVTDVHDELTRRLKNKTTHASSVRASVARKGWWPNFDFYEITGAAQLRQSISSVEILVTEISCVLSNQLEQPDLVFSKGMLQQLKHSIEKNYILLKNLAFTHGKEDYWIVAQCGGADWEWSQMQSEWGKGPGYKIRVAGGVSNVFRDKNILAVKHRETAEALSSAWSDLVSLIRRNVLQE